MMRQRIISLAAVSLLFISMALTAMWVRSHLHSDLVFFDSVATAGSTRVRVRYSVKSQGGGLVLSRLVLVAQQDARRAKEWELWPTRRESRFEWHPRSLRESSGEWGTPKPRLLAPYPLDADEPSYVLQRYQEENKLRRWGHFGVFGSLKGPSSLEVPRQPVATIFSSNRGLVVPYWFVVLLTAALPLARVQRAWRWLRGVRRRRRGLCRTCGYDIRASGERCPECGTTVAATSSTPTGPAPKVESPAGTHVK